MTTLDFDKLAVQAEFERVQEEEAEEAAEAEATARRYGGHCAVCGVLRDYHRPSMQNALFAEMVTNHKFQPR